MSATIARKVRITSVLLSRAPKCKDCRDTGQVFGIAWHGEVDEKQCPCGAGQYEPQTDPSADFPF